MLDCQKAYFLPYCGFEIKRLFGYVLIVSDYLHHLEQKFFLKTYYSYIYVHQVCPLRLN